MARFEKLEQWEERVMMRRTEKLWNAGYNSMDIAKRLRRPIDEVQNWIKKIVAETKTTT